jgi:benzoate membrane transport protein
MRLSVVISALVAALVGFGGTVALVVTAAQAVGADLAQTNSWVAALCIAIAATSFYLSLRHRIPIITAWSTPGAALIAATAGVSYQAAVGAFLFAGALIVVTAAAKPVANLIGRIPAEIAAAMLAGILIRFAMAIFEHAAGEPWLVLPLVLLFLVVRLASPSGAVIAVLVVGVALTWMKGLVPGVPLSFDLLSLSPVAPAFDPAVLIGLGLPLYLVTMASQNLAGFAVLRASGYPAPAQSILAATGIASMLTAPFGAHATNLAAISAAICTGPDAHPVPDKRWQTGPVYAAVYVAFAVLGGSLVALITAMPAALVATVAGLALVGPLVNALGAALARPEARFAATLTLAVAASGMTLFGIGSAFWGLLAGLGVLGLERLRVRLPSAG